MRQVPMGNKSTRELCLPEFKKYLILGRGNVASHLAEYFRLLNLPFVQWHRGIPESELALGLMSSSHILLAVSDLAWPNLVAQLSLEYQGKVWVHFSGSLSSPLAFAAHPLMTFSKHLYTLFQYEQIHFALEDRSLKLEDLLPGLKNSSFFIDPGQKALYHAWCAMAGNFTAMLWSEFFERLEGEFKLSRHIAFPYLRQQCINSIDLGSLAITGPVQRNDQQIIKKHLDALKDDSYLSVYEGFLRAKQKDHDEKHS